MLEPALGQGMQHDFADVLREEDPIARFETERIEADLQGRSSVSKASNRETFLLPSADELSSGRMVHKLPPRAGLRSG